MITHDEAENLFLELNEAALGQQDTSAAIIAAQRYKFLCKRLAEKLPQDHKYKTVLVRMAQQIETLCRCVPLDNNQYECFIRLVDLLEHKITKTIDYLEGQEK